MKVIYKVSSNIKKKNIFALLVIERTNDQHKTLK